jgi:hypothetical protein
MACSRVTLPLHHLLIRSYSRFSLLFSCCECVSFHVFHITSYPPPPFGYTFFFHWVWLCRQHRSRQSAKIGCGETLLLRAKQRWPLPVHVPLAHLSMTSQSTAYKSNIVILVCNLVLLDRERALKEERSSPDRVWYRGQTEGHNVQLGLLTHSITPVKFTHDVSVMGFTLSTRNTFTNSSCSSSLYTLTLLLVCALSRRSRWVRADDECFGEHYIFSHGESIWGYPGAGHAITTHTLPTAWWI